MAARKKKKAGKKKAARRELIKGAEARAIGNKRKTLKAVDL